MDLSCFNDYSQNYLICVTIHKAKNLAFLNKDTFVVVEIGKLSKRTAVYENSDCPYFNEYFVFELVKNLRELLSTNVVFTVFHRTCCARKNQPIGELIVDLSIVWNQPYHSFYKQWGILDSPLGEADDEITCRGYLQVDLSIISKYEKPRPALLETRDYDAVDENLMTPIIGDMEKTKVKYSVKIYGGYFIENLNYCCQICFAGVMGRTKYTKRSKYPEWNQQFEFLWYYPSLCETVKILVKSIETCSFTLKSSIEINLSEISNDITEFPTFGPTYLHLYDPNNPLNYVGRLLVGIDVEAIDKSTVISRKLNIRDIPLLQENDFWSQEIFTINLCLLEINCLHSPKTKFKIQFTCGDQASEVIELQSTGYSKSNCRFIQIPSDSIPILTTNLKQPDNRLKFDTDIQMKAVSEQLRRQLSNWMDFSKENYKDVKMCRKFLKLMVETLANTLKTLTSNFFFKVYKEVTNWDRNHMNFKLKILERSLNELDSLIGLLDKNDKNLICNLKIVVNHVERMCGYLENVSMNKVCDTWPNLNILLSSGNQLIGYSVLDPKPCLYHANTDFCGLLCNVHQSIVFKRNSCTHTCNYCGCVLGTGEILLWIGLEQDLPHCIPSNFSMSGYNLWCRSFRQFDLKVYVHQAKIRPGQNKNGLCDAKLNVFFNSFMASTKYILNSLSPDWNQVIEFKCLSLAYDIATIDKYPPIIIIDLMDFHAELKKDIYVGTTFLAPQVRLLTKPIIQNLIQQSDWTNDENSIEHNEPDFQTPDEHTSHDENVETTEKGKNFLKEIKKFPTKIKTVAMKKNKIIPDIDNPSTFPPFLKWIPLLRDGINIADILCSAELIEIENVPNDCTTEVKISDSLPAEICPIIKRFKIEMLVAGLRDANKFPQNTIGKFFIEATFGELILRCGLSAKRQGNSINFLDPFVIGFVNLPEQLDYWPPLILKLLMTTKKETIISAAMISETDKFYLRENRIKSVMSSYLSDNVSISLENLMECDEYQPLLNPYKNKRWFQKVFDHTKIKQVNFKRRLDSEHKERKNNFEHEYNWWTKFYNSFEFNEGKHRLTIFDSELENQSQFSNLCDWAAPFQLVKGFTYRTNQSIQSPNTNVNCTIKCSIQVRKFSAESDFEERISKSKLQEIISIITETPVTLRIYCVQAINLRSRDQTGNSDSYIKIEFGNKSLTDRAHYIPNQTNPIYGKRFQLDGVIPRDQHLKIHVYDRDQGLNSDDLIGTTIIDVENRLRSRHRAYGGISQEYNKAGYNIWRNPYKPSEILNQICHKYEIDQPTVIGNTIQVGGITFDDTTRLSSDESLEERLCLSVLKELDRIPAIGFKIVPEHVETRSLYRNDCPGIEQGKLQMWLEIYSSDNIPPPIDLTPHPPRLFELRVIIWNTSNVILNEMNIFGKGMSDIYIKCWLSDVNDAQFTDVHYRSMNGDGFFNWRMIFPIKYSIVEEMMVIKKKKTVFEKFDTEYKMPPNLHIQIWDNDSVSADDFLGSTTINLADFMKPASTAAKCIDSQKDDEHLNLFHKQKIRGWFPCYGHLADKSKGITGKIDMEMEVLLEDDALINSVGLGRDPPIPLPMPNRPDTSFNWYRNPLKSLRHIILPQIKKFIIYFIILLAITLIGYFVATSIPKLFIKESVKGISSAVMSIPSSPMSKNCSWC